MGNINFKTLSNKNINNYTEIKSFNNEELLMISEKYCLKEKDIVIFYKIFEKLCSSYESYLTKKDFLYFFQEIEGSVMSLYVNFLFKIILKKKEDILEFNEWIQGIIDFVNLNEKNINRFVFKMIDENNDEIISIKDIMNFISKKNTIDDKYIFPVNEISLYKNLDIESWDIDRLDFINQENFFKFRYKLSYILYPAFRMQEYIKRKILYKKFWKDINFDINEKENMNDKKKKNEEKIEENLKQTQKKKLNEYKKNYEDIINFNKLNNKIISFKKNKFNRNKIRRSSFSNLNEMKKIEIKLIDNRINKSFYKIKNIKIQNNEILNQNSLEASINKDTFNNSKYKSTINNSNSKIKKLQNYFN